MIKQILTVKICALLLLFSAGVSAHHGWTWYTGEALELTGTITAMRWGNPHDRFTVQVEGQSWDVWLGPPGRNKRAGFRQGVVQVGDQVTFFGHRHADGKRFEMKTERIKFGDAVFNMYPERE